MKALQAYPKAITDTQKVHTHPSENSRMLAVQGSCELAYSPAVAMHLPVASWRGVGTTFVAGRTTAVVPRNSSNVFGARYVAL